ncbi:MAG: hypothetical protein K9N23_10685 [Akkermansiaceae bacterium]|nr:hypothetical protein [Akkermansiaceae bacterium]
MDTPSSSAPSRRRPRRPWALSFFGLLAVAGLISMPILAGAPNGAKMPDMVRFLGHFHPLLLHLPIGVMVLILLQELGAIFFRRGQEIRRAPVFPMFFGAASAMLAVLAGFLLYHGGGFEDNPTAERHLWGGLVFAVLAVLTCIVRAWTAEPGSNPALYRLMLFVSVGVMGFASHDGASLTHGADYLTAYAPNPLRKILGLPERAPTPATPATVAAKPIEDQIVYTDVVAPILERRCVACHREGKVKGGVRLDSFETIIAGTKSGPILTPGDAAKSHMIALIELPPGDVDRMPKGDNPAPTPEEISILKWWIDQGADGTKTVKELAATPEITAAIATLAPVVAANPDATTTVAPAAPAAGPDAALAAAVAALTKEFPGAVTFESQESSAVTLSAASLRGTLDDAVFAKFAPVVPYLVTADLTASKLTDQGVSDLAAAKNLRLVRLAETPVTDAAIETLLRLPALESINLYGTKVTDAGVLKLVALPKLKRLYLWQTPVTPAAVATLREQLPNCEIVTGT